MAKSKSVTNILVKGGFQLLQTLFSDLSRIAEALERIADQLEAGVLAIEIDKPIDDKDDEPEEED